MKDNRQPPRLAGLHFQLDEEQHLRSLLLADVVQHRALWRLLRLWRLARRYLSQPGRLAAKVRQITGRAEAPAEGFRDAYRRKMVDYTRYLLPGEMRPEDAARIEALIKQKAYRGILVYPHAVPWEPLQRPQQILRVFARQGYLCFFCEPYASPMAIQQKAENIYVISGEQYLIYPLQNYPVIVLCTWLLNLPFINFLPKRVLWYDLLDRLDFFSLYDADMERKHTEVVCAADIVTYSGLMLKQFVAQRDDALYLPNGVALEDFSRVRALPADHDDPALRVLQEARRRGRPVIGFYGAIAEWIDLGLVQAAAQLRPDWEFVFIGRESVDLSAVKRLPNVQSLGLVAYERLPGLASQFDVAMIPFSLSPLTDCVSPIKFFEYAALGLPVVTTPFYEVRQYQGAPFVRFAHHPDEFVHQVEDLLNANRQELSAAARAFAQEHQWERHLQEVLEKFSES